MAKYIRLLVVLCVCAAVSQACYGRDFRVLILYDSGNESLRLGDIPDYRYPSVQATTLPTPFPVNVRYLSRKLAHELRERGHIRAVYAHISEIDLAETLLGYDLICIGSPTYFSNMSWPVKRFYDYSLSRFFFTREKKLTDRSFSVFTMGVDADSALDCVEIMEKGLRHVTNDLVPGMVASQEMNEDELDRKIQVYADRLEKELHRIGTLGEERLRLYAP
jgi:hypothetical protein